jgi:phosphoglycolate phosphatase-like HAD superfamily hydrolase
MLRFVLTVVTVLMLAHFVSTQTDFISFASATTNTTHTVTDPLPSWNEGVTKQRISEFVQNVTDIGNTKYYIPPEDRIAVFDNDGTLWSEKPLYFQGYFAIDRVDDLVANKPELKDKFPFKEILDKNLTALKGMDEKDVMNLVLATHSNISQTEFDNLVQQWAETAKHPETQRKFIDMVYQPMIELINYLKAHQFNTFIVSGGGIDFMRESLSQIYGIPSEQIIGSSVKYQFIDSNTGNSTIIRKAELNSFDDKAEKPVNIELHIGKVPVIAIGNSDGDLQMLKYVDDNNDYGKSLEIEVHHDDKIREYSYDTHAENILKEAKNRNWIVVSMANDFKEIYPSNK